MDLLTQVLDFLIGWPLVIALAVIVGWAIIWSLGLVATGFVGLLALVCPPFRRWRDSQRYWAEH